MDWQKYIDVERLKSWMDGQGIGSGEFEAPHLLAGGTQNILLRFTRNGQTYVLRRPPIHLRPNSNKTMKREAQALRALAGSKVPHPRFIALCDDVEIIGACFYLMESVDGFNPSQGLLALHQSDPEIRRRMGFAMVDAIAELASVDYVAAGLKDFGKPDGFIDRQVPRWRSQLESYNEYDNWPGQSKLPHVNEIADWLEANKPNSFQAGIFHGDFHFANVMFQNNSAELAAIIDWELCSIGDPMIDLGWLIAGWPDPKTEHTLDLNVLSPWDGFPTIDELIARYGERTGRELSDAPWYGVLACFKLAVILEGTFARACSGVAPRDVGEHLHDLAIRLFRRAFRMIENS